MDRVQGNQYSPQKSVHYMLQERSQTNAENASQPLMNDANIENNTGNQPSSKKWGPWKIAAAVTAGIIAVGGVAGAVVGALYVTGNLSFGPADTAKDLMSRDVSNTTVLNNGTTPAYTEASTSEDIISYISNKLSEAVRDVTDAISLTTPTTPTTTSTTPTTTPTTPTTTPTTPTTTSTDTTSLETTTLDPCSPEGKARELERIKEHTGSLYTRQGGLEYLEYIRQCSKYIKRN